MSEILFSDTLLSYNSIKLLNVHLSMINTSKSLPTRVKLRQAYSTVRTVSVHVHL